MDNTFLLIDGNSILHRAYYAIPLLSNRQGHFTNAVYGFTTMLTKLLEIEAPGYVVVAFDRGRTSFRNQYYQDYKGHRKATPDELRPQFAMARRLLQGLGVAWYELEGFEADDIIGTLARLAEEQGLEVTIVTGDRDALQLISPRTRVLLTKKGISDLHEWTLAEVEATFGLTPGQLVDVKALEGDPSDNIPGVPGIGQKTAVKLVKQFGSLEEILSHLSGVESPRLSSMLEQHCDQAILSKKLALIDRWAPIELDPQDCRFRGPDLPYLLSVYKELEFQSLIPALLQKMKDHAGAGTATVGSGGILRSHRELLEFISGLGEGPVALYLDLVPKGCCRYDLKALGIADSKNHYGGILPGMSLPVSCLVDSLRPLVENPVAHIICHDAKTVQHFFRDWSIQITARLDDTILMAYLLNPSAASHALPDVSLEHLDRALVPQDDPAGDAAGKALTVLELYREMMPKLMENKLLSLYREVELPLVAVLVDMEQHGMTLDRDRLGQIGEELAQGIEKLTKEIYFLAGEEFNINSPKQLGTILFERLGLPPIKKTKTGYSTSAEVLEELASHHRIVAHLLEYRQLIKLKTTYVDGLMALVDPVTSKVHTTFNQTVTATGRLSSTEPNLQNIPIRLEQGRRLRQAFTASGHGRLLLAADYSQIELRVLAHISGDEIMVEAFRQNEDIHTRTAAEVFGVPISEVTPDMRRSAKAVNFGIVYGISDYGLSRDLGITRKEARNFIDRYLARYPGVSAYLKKVVQEARDRGYVTTLLGRRRYLPDLFSSNFSVRGFGERTAMNTPIQGTAADIIKLAMLRVSNAIKREKLPVEMVLQVHDELLFEVETPFLAKAAELIRKEMEKAIDLVVPLRVDVKYGSDWYDMTSYKED